MDFLGTNWLWLYAGAILMLAELMAPGFVIFFFGLAAATVGLILSALPESIAPGLTVQLALFSALSILYLLTLRRYAKRTFIGETATDALADEYTGRVAKVTQTIRPEAPGRILIGDAEWSATATERLDPGADVRIVARNNLTMKVERVV